MTRLRHLATKPWIVMPVVAVVAVGGWALVRGEGDDNTAAATTGEQLVEATLGSVSQTVSAEGIIAYAETEDLSFTASGTVTAVNVAAGQTVTVGTVLAELDSPELEADAAEAETAVAEAEATLADDEDVGASDTRLAADHSALATAEDRLAAAQEALDGARLVASFDATVASVDITEGETLGSGGTGGTSLTGSGSGSGQSSSGLGSGDSGLPGGGGGDQTDTAGSPHIQLVSADAYVIELGFDDTDINSLEIGQTADISLSTSSGGGPGFGGGGGLPGGGRFPGGGAVAGGGFGQQDINDDDDEAAPNAVSGVDAVDGEVTEVGTVADASSGVATYPVTVEFSDDSGDYNAGATVLVDITYAEKTDVLLVPSFAVSTADGVSTVTVDADGDRETRTVTAGLTSGAMVEITDGLDAGETVVISRPTGFGGQGGGQGPPDGFPGLGAGSEDGE